MNDKTDKPKMISPFNKKKFSILRRKKKTLSAKLK